MGPSGVANGETCVHGPPPSHSWKPRGRKKRSRGPKSDDDDVGFEVVPIKDPGESSAPTRMGGNMEGSVLGTEL